MAILKRKVSPKNSEVFWKVTVPQLQNNENEKQGKKTLMNQLPKEFFNAPNEKEK